MIDFVAAALDTTVLASTHLLWALAHNPDAWTQIRKDPSLIPAAVIENVRLSSPIRGFTRRTAKHCEIGGTAVPEGARVAVLFGAANLDETQFPDPERFDLHRQNRMQLGWGNGAHTCIDLHLSKLEMQALLRAMAPHVSQIHVGEPRRLLNNTLQGITHLPARFTPAPTSGRCRSAASQSSPGTPPFAPWREPRSTGPATRLARNAGSALALPA